MHHSCAYRALTCHALSMRLTRFHTFQQVHMLSVLHVLRTMTAALRLQGKLGDKSTLSGMLGCCMMTGCLKGQTSFWLTAPSPPSDPFTLRKDKLHWKWRFWCIYPITVILEEAESSRTCTKLIQGRLFWAHTAVLVLKLVVPDLFPLEFVRLCKSGAGFCAWSKHLMYIMVKSA